MASRPPTQVKAEGRLNSRIVLIGEAPGKEEALQGRPFCGPSYEKRLKWWWREVGLQRRDFYIDNVYPFRPPNNKLAAADPADVGKWTQDLHSRIARLKNPELIVVTGEVALNALTGRRGISKWRGSILSYESPVDGRVIKVIPTYHPAYTFRQPKHQRTCQEDWKRIARELERGPEIIEPEVDHVALPTLDDISWWVGAYIGAGQERVAPELVIDAEWAPIKKDRPEIQLLCVGFAVDGVHSICIPTTLDYWGRKADLETAMQWVAWLCESDVPKVLHHGHSDAYVLGMPPYGIGIEAYDWDTLGMHHCLDPGAVSHTLDFLSSIFNEHYCFWKEEAKDAESIAKYASDLHALYAYNGMDVRATHELFVTFKRMLERQGLMDQYVEFYRSVMPALIRLSMTGMRVDDSLRRRKNARLEVDRIRLRKEVIQASGVDVFGPKKGISGVRFQKWLYGKDDGQLGLKKVTRRRKKASGETEATASADAVALRRLMQQHPDVEVLQEVGRAVLEYRRKSKLLEFYS